jgi:allantoate deiminase
MTALAQEAIEACRTIATFSESADNITRTYLSPPIRDAQAFLSGWMARLGMESSIDAVGNLRGIRRGRHADAPRLILGSHIDTVPNAGAFDGILGVVLALILIEALEDHPLDYDIEFVAFSEEEGVRFAVPFIGSLALTGGIDDALLSRTDARSITLRRAIEDFGLDPAEIPQAALDPKTFAYVEFHIEQGPVLESLNLSLGVVEAIVGRARYELTFRGSANHAGTTPMNLRRDALAGAAEWIGAVERAPSSTPGLVATVGRIEVTPGATNVIPGEARVSLDIRHASDESGLAAAESLLAEARRIASARGLALDAILQSRQPATAMNSALARSLEQAAIATGATPHRMVSGAGHDAQILATKVPAAMLFLRSPGGVSHHPDESVLVEDVRAAIDAGLYFLKHLDAAA